MPKSAKIRKKQKNKLAKKESQAPSFTTKKSYWITLTVLLAVVTLVFGVSSGISIVQNAILTLTIVVVIGFLGFVRTTQSKLSLSKRATFIFVGGSVIGFAIWAAITLSGIMVQLVNEVGQEFYVLTSLAICLTVGAFIGELLGRNKKIQEQLFLGLKN
jgi:hypothetical protein